MQNPNVTCQLIWIVVGMNTGNHELIGSEELFQLWVLESTNWRNEKSCYEASESWYRFQFTLRAFYANLFSQIFSESPREAKLRTTRKLNSACSTSMISSWWNEHRIFSQNLRKGGFRSIFGVEAFRTSLMIMRPRLCLWQLPTSSSKSDKTFWGLSLSNRTVSLTKLSRIFLWENVGLEQLNLRSHVFHFIHRSSWMYSNHFLIPQINHRLKENIERKACQLSQSYATTFEFKFSEEFP